MLIFTFLYYSFWDSLAIAWMQLLNEMSWKEMVRFLFNDLLLLLRGLDLDLEPLLLLFLSEKMVLQFSENFGLLIVTPWAFNYSVDAWMLYLFDFLIEESRMNCSSFLSIA